MLGHPLRGLAPALATLLLVGLLWSPTPDRAAAADGPGAVVSAPDTARIGRSTTVQVTVQPDAGRSSSGLTVHLERQSQDGAWTSIAEAMTSAEGVASFRVVPVAGAQELRAAFADGDVPVVSAPVTLEGVVVSSTLHIYGSASVVDEHSGHLSIRWVGSDGFAVRGRVGVWFHKSGGSWTKLGTTSTDWSGTARVTVRPRWDTYYQLRGAPGAGWKSDISPTWKIDNRPPLTPVTLPWGAPRPYSLPAQGRAIGEGTNIAVHLISDAVWKRMVGRSWHAGCPVGRSQLRYLTTNYWGFDGYRHRGELVVRDNAVYKFRSALMKLYGNKVPIRAMYLPDRFGKNPTTPGANDVQSMKHDNTSAFNCRGVTGNPGTRSPHSYGASIDLNPFENPFHSRVGWLPNRWWAHKQVGKYAWKARSSLVVQLMGQAGFRWTYATTDSQHFDG
ncbi:MAG: M15 family metallopeptidase [Marmoricola sp.]